MLTTTRTKAILLLASLTLVSGPLRAEERKLEQIGLRLETDKLFQKRLENPDRVELRHPYIATEWWWHFLRKYGKRMEENVELPPSEGPYEDKRPVLFYLTPLEFGDHLAWSGAGLTIRSMRYLREEKRVETVLSLAYRAAVTVSFPASVEEFRTVLLLHKALRLRILFSCRSESVKGFSVEGDDWLELKATGPMELEARDMLKPLFTREKDLQVRPFSPRSLIDAPKLGTPDAGQGDESEKDAVDDEIARETQDAEARRDPAFGVGVPEKPVRMLLGMEACKHLSYSEGMQPFRRGWILKDAFPKLSPTYDKYEYARPLPNVIALCEHTGTPSSMTLTLKEPLPPGLYKVSLMTTPYRCRKLNNIVHLKLGDDEVETAWLLGQPPWVAAPGLRTTVPTRKLTITAIQAGSGSRHEAPPYPRWWIAIGRVYITNVLDDPPGGVKPKEEEENGE